MKLTLTQKELLILINDYLKIEPSVQSIAIEVKTERGIKDIIHISKDNWFVGSFIEEEIKNKDRS